MTDLSHVALCDLSYLANYLTVGGRRLFEQRNEEVLAATSSQGDTSYMVCKTADENKTQKICTDITEKSQASTTSKTTSSKERMLDNNIYDLMEQLLIEKKSLWRIKNNYKKDAAMDNEVKQLWNVIEKDKEELVQMLSEKLRERL